MKQQVGCWIKNGNDVHVFHQFLHSILIVNKALVETTVGCGPLLHHLTSSLNLLWDKTWSHLVFWPRAFARTLCVMKPRRAVDVLMPVELKRESQTSSNWAKYNCFSEHTLNIGNVWKTVKRVEPSGNFNSGKNKSTLSNLCKLLGGTLLTPHHKHFKHLSFHELSSLVVA